MKLVAVLFASLLLTCLCSCSSRSPFGSGPSASSNPANKQFLERARPLLPGESDTRLADVAIMVCDQFMTNADGSDTTEIEVRRSAPIQVSTSAANDSMQAAVLWHCPHYFDPGDFVHPHKYDH